MVSVYCAGLLRSDFRFSSVSPTAIFAGRDSADFEVGRTCPFPGHRAATRVPRCGGRKPTARRLSPRKPSLRRKPPVSRHGSEAPPVRTSGPSRPASRYLGRPWRRHPFDRRGALERLGSETLRRARDRWRRHRLRRRPRRRRSRPAHRPGRGAGFRIRHLLQVLQARPRRPPLPAAARLPAGLRGSRTSDSG